MRKPNPRSFNCPTPDKRREEQPGANLKEKSRENQKTLRLRKRNVREELLADALRIPADVCEGAMRVTMTGNSRAWVENYKGILEYTEHTVLLQGKTGRVCFEGDGLCIVYYTCDDMLIRGRIREVRFES